MVGRVSAGPEVVPFEAILDIARDPDVVPVRVTVAPENIDKAFAYSFHGAEQCKARTTWTPPFDSESRPDPTRVRRLCDSGFKSSGRNVRLRSHLRRTGRLRRELRRDSLRLSECSRSGGGRGFKSLSGGPPSRLAFDGSHSGGRFGETAFACPSVRGPVAGEGSNRCRVVRLRGSPSMARTPAAASARQPSPVRVFAVRWRERVQIAVGGPPSRLAFDGSPSGGRCGETAFACQSVASVVAGLFT